MKFSIGVVVSTFLAACATAGGTDDDNGNPQPDANRGLIVDAGDPVDAGTAAPDAAPDAMTSSADCTEDATLSCGQTISGTVLNEDASINGYSCQQVETTGVDRVFRFVPATSGAVTLDLDIEMDDPIFGDDYDIYLLEDVCGASNCVAQSAELGDESLTFTATAGTTYYVVVEVFGLGVITFGNYDLTATCP